MSTKQSTRRTRARRGIYYRVGTDGKRHYEITFTDSTGRQRWQAVEGGIEDAEQARSDVLGRKRKGGSVAPKRQTFKDAGSAWLDRQTQVRSRTREAYEYALRVHLTPVFGRMQVAAIGEDEIAEFIAAMQAKGYSGWTIQAALKPLRGVLNWAARKGQIPENPMHRLERSERPKVTKTKVNVLSSDLIQKVIDGADAKRDRPLIATALFSGCRIAELCGLIWQDIDLENGYIRVRYQLDRNTRQRVPLKTDDGCRDVVLIPALGRMLREYRLRCSPLFSKDTDFVFPTHTGGGLDQTVARRAFERAMDTSGVDRSGVVFHTLRHTFASLLIGQGEDVVFVSRQLGHSDPSITLGIYAHLFDQARHAADFRARQEDRYGEMLATDTRHLAAVTDA